MERFDEADAQLERFDAYMERRLYGESGFYATGGSAGRRGDFITSPEVGPLFGLVLSRLIESWWLELGQPETLPVYDVGTGPGTLLVSLASADPACSAAWQLAGVDRAGPAEFRTLPDDLSGCVIVANELFDNMAFRIVERRSEDSWFEVFVDSSDQTAPPVERLVETESPGLAIPVGARAPLHSQATAWLDHVLAQGAERVITLDYGALTTAELAERGGWLRTYAGHIRGDDPYAPGSYDITTDVGFDQFPTPSSATTQAELLRSLGIDELVAEGKELWAANAAKPNLQALKMRSRVSEAEALCDPAGLGSWQAVIWSAADASVG